MRASFVSLVTLCLVTARPLIAQGYPFSQRGAVEQRVAFTDIRVEYGRPTARGRALFGALVPWDSVWHPGADLATQLSVSQDITLEDRPVPKGRYTIWLVPRATGAWTLILNRTTNIQHTPYPGAGTDALRIDVAPDQASHLETLTYLFPAVLRDEATLRMQWGTTGISVRIKAAYRPGT
jgi:Protein of unknown function (DUF2911)